MAENISKIADLNMKAAKFKDVLQRISNKGENNILALALQVEIDALIAGMGALHFNGRVLNRMLEIMSDYAYRVNIDTDWNMEL